MFNDWVPRSLICKHSGTIGFRPPIPPTPPPAPPPPTRHFKLRYVTLSWTQQKTNACEACHFIVLTSQLPLLQQHSHRAQSDHTPAVTWVSACLDIYLGPNRDILNPNRRCLSRDLNRGTAKYKTELITTLPNVWCHLSSVYMFDISITSEYLLQLLQTVICKKQNYICVYTLV